MGVPPCEGVLGLGGLRRGAEVAGELVVINVRGQRSDPWEMIKDVRILEVIC